MVESTKGDLVGKSSKLPGPDPVIGVGLVILGVLVMGIAGASTAHYAFNIGTGIAILGAITFLVSVTLSTLRLGPPRGGDQSAPGA
jgi:hypothetical protein